MSINRNNSCNTSPEKRQLRLAVAKMYDALNMLYSLDNTTIERELFNEYQVYRKTELTKGQAFLFKAPQMLPRWLGFVLRVAQMFSKNIRENAVLQVLQRHITELKLFFANREVSLKTFILDFMCNALPQVHAEKLVMDIKFHIRRFIRLLVLPRIRNQVFQKRK